MGDNWEVIDFEDRYISRAGFLACFCGGYSLIKIRHITATTPQILLLVDHFVICPLPTPASSAISYKLLADGLLRDACGLPVPNKLSFRPAG